MSLLVQFSQSDPLNRGDGKLAVFQMSAVPDVGETVVLKKTDYVVESRRWVPGRPVSSLLITVRKS